MSPKPELTSRALAARSRLLGQAVDDDDVRRRVQPHERGGNPEIPPLAQVPERDREEERPRLLRGAEIAFVEGGAQLDLEMLTRGGRLDDRPVVAGSRRLRGTRLRPDGRGEGENEGSDDQRDAAALSHPG